MMMMFDEGSDDDEFPPIPTYVAPSSSSCVDPMAGCRLTAPYDHLPHQPQPALADEQSQRLRELEADVEMLKRALQQKQQQQHAHQVPSPQAWSNALGPSPPQQAAPESSSLMWEAPGEEESLPQQAVPQPVRLSSSPRLPPAETRHPHYHPHYPPHGEVHSGNHARELPSGFSEPASRSTAAMAAAAASLHHVIQNMGSGRRGGGGGGDAPPFDEKSEGNAWGWANATVAATPTPPTPTCIAESEKEEEKEETHARHWVPPSVASRAATAPPPNSNPNISTLSEDGHAREHYAIFIPCNEMNHHQNGAEENGASDRKTAKLTSGRRRNGPVGGSSSVLSSSSSLSLLPPSSQSHTTAGMDEQQQQRQEAMTEMELRRLVPHLSAGFHCSYSDCMLITAAIRNGGCTSASLGGAGRHHNGAGRGVGSGAELSLQDRLHMVEAEKKMLQQRLHKQVAECEQLKRDVLEQKEKVETVRREAKQSSTYVGQKRDEMRRQLLLEETRSEKLRVQNRKLEAELDQLKQRVRGSY